MLPAPVAVAKALLYKKITNYKLQITNCKFQITDFKWQIYTS